MHIQRVRCTVSLHEAVKYSPANLDEEYDDDNQQDEQYDCTDDGTGDGTGRKVIGLFCNLNKEIYRFQ